MLTLIKDLVLWALFLVAFVAAENSPLEVEEHLHQWSCVVVGLEPWDMGCPL